MNTTDFSSIVKQFESVSATTAFAARFARILKAGDLLLFTGEIGAGKTTFVQALAKNLGISEMVTSPSFVLHTMYESEKILLSHVDLYRLSSDTEVERIGFEDYLDTAVTAIEWADRYSNFQPPFVTLNFVYGTSENERTLTISPNGGDWATRLLTLQ